jgi:glycerate 2-kinase
MASGLEELIGDRITAGSINVKYGHTANLSIIRLQEAGHPLPDENGVQGANHILSLARNADSHDLVLCLLSGGGSALLPLPAAGLSLADKQAATDILLSCGANIHQINAIRKHLSRIKGGRLAQAVAPARLTSLILSDVVGDDLDAIASGPTVGDASTFVDCREIIRRYDIERDLPPAVVQHIDQGCRGEIAETPKPDDPLFAKVSNLIIGSNREALLAARQTALELGYTPLVLSSLMEGETRFVARVHAAMAREITQSGHPVPAPACLLSGGETTVTLRGRGLGGRNQEFALAAVRDLANAGHIVLLSAGTDGTDGPTDAAGAIADSRTAARALRAGIDSDRYLAENDSYHFFQKLDDLLITGPTHTNVMDLRIVLVT